MCYKIYQSKNSYAISLFFATLKENCANKDYFDIKKCDELEINNELIDE